MARISSFSVLVVMVLVHGLVVLSPGLASRVILESISESPNVRNIEFLEACARKLTADCGESVFMIIFANASRPVNDHCCRLLVAMGRPCHDGLVNNIIEKIHDYETNESVIRPKSVEIWNKCALVTENVSSSYATIATKRIPQGFISTHSKLSWSFLCNKLKLGRHIHRICD
ncbi:protein DOWN-REGULATED IN DIF1 11-like [Fagus crenata]